MPLPSKISQLPEDVRQWLERELIARGFSGYVELSELLAERGYEIGKSAVHKYGQKLDRKLSAIKASTEAARMIAEYAPDDEDSRSAAVISLLQTDIFDVILALQESEDADASERVKLLSNAARSIAELSRASVNQKRFARETREKLKTRLDALDGEAKAGGLDAATLARVRQEIYGIVGQ
jgi:hypothetical protein